MQKVKMLIPQYIKQFRCIGGECEDTCCAGWKVSIDEETYKKYKRINDYMLRKKVSQYVGRDRINFNKQGVAKIRLEKGSCPFLLEEKLCEIQDKLGEGYLSNTCAIYPRLNKGVDKAIEQSLTLSCPEATRLVLLNEKPIEFDQEEREFTHRDLGIDKITISNYKVKWKDYFWELRIFTISLLQNRQYSIEERLMVLGLFYNKLEECINENKIDEIEDWIKKYNKNIESGVYKKLLKDIPKVLEMQLKLCKELVDIRYSMALGSERYKKYLGEMLCGLKFTGETTVEESIKAYEEGYEKYYRPFMAEHSYVLENYLVNYTFSNLLPIDQERPFESYVRMVLHYLIVKVHLVGQANYHEGLTPEIIVASIQSLVKTFEHNKPYFSQILRLIKENGYMDLAHIAILIRN